MERIINKFVSKVYFILYGTRQYENFKPSVEITSDSMIIVTPSSSILFYDESDISLDIAYFYDRIHTMDNLMKVPVYHNVVLSNRFRQLFSNKIYKSGDNYYSSMSSLKEFIVNRIFDGYNDTHTVDDYHYVIVIPFKKIEYNSYLDDLPQELQHIISLKAKITTFNKEIKDIFKIMFNSSLFKWEQFFADSYPRLYSDIKNYQIKITNFEMMYNYIVYHCVDSNPNLTQIKDDTYHISSKRSYVIFKAHDLKDQYEKISLTHY